MTHGHQAGGTEPCRVRDLNDLVPESKRQCVVVEIRRAEPGDVAALAVLMDELDRFYGSDPVAPPAGRAPEIAANLFAEPVAGYVLLAWEDGRLAGMAAYSFLWPAAGVTRSMYLKELHVREASRGRGIGTLLIRRLAQIACEHGCSRLEWTADADNAAATTFYERLGVPQDRAKIVYRLAGEGLRTFATRC